MNGFSFSESAKVHDITNRLASLSSPVLRLQAILQFSQIVDILAIGDTSSSREHELVDKIDKLQNRVNELEDVENAEVGTIS